jgi:hypothetical protein
MSREGWIRIFWSLAVLGVAAAVVVSIGPGLRAAETQIDLDGNPANGKESRLVTRVLQSYPVVVENVVFNNATGESFVFEWPGAGPGGFTSFVTRGPDVGVKWEWSTVSQVYTISTPANFERDAREVPVFGAPSGGIQAPGPNGAFATQGKSIFPTQVTVSSASLTSSLVTFFSPENEIAVCTGRFEPFQSRQEILNASGQALSFTIEQPDCCPDADMTICPDGCQYFLTDPNNCGECGNVCAGDEFCSQGFCEPICPEGQTYCPDEMCYDLMNDPNNCGACGNACGADDVCVTGVCEPICPDGQTLCGETCYDLLSDPDNCGSCGNQCADDEYCSQGSCESICPEGLTLCGTECVDLSSDLANCGSCGNRCGSNDICSVGACYTCRPPLQTACDNQCVNIHTDPYNCGECGFVCDFSDCPSTGTGTCSMGTSCVCDPAPTVEGFSSAIEFEPQFRFSSVRGRARPARLETTDRSRSRSAPRRRHDSSTKLAAASRTPSAVTAPVCDIGPIEQTIPDGGTYTQCQSGAMVGKEIFTTVTVEADGEIIGQGPCALIVPATQSQTEPFMPSPTAAYVQDQSGDGLCQPGETCELLVEVQNLGDAAFTNPVGILSSPPDEFNPTEITLLNAASQYPDFPAFVASGDCDTPVELDPKTNFTAFSFTLPPEQDPDVGRVFNVSFQDMAGTLPAVAMPIVLGIGSTCDPNARLDGETYDGVDGLKSPLNAPLVPEGNPANYAPGTFNQTKTMPLKVSLGCGPRILDPSEIDPAPEIVALIHDTLGPQPLEGINGDNGANPDDPFFLCGTSRCEYQLRTKQLPIGTYVISIAMPDTRVFQAGFTLVP